MGKTIGALGVSLLIAVVSACGESSSEGGGAGAGGKGESGGGTGNGGATQGGGGADTVRGGNTGRGGNDSGGSAGTGSAGGGAGGSAGVGGEPQEGGAGGQGGSGAGSFGLNDVSILFPIPEAANDGLYRLDEEGKYGPLLPLSYAQQVGTITRMSCGASSPAGCEMTEPIEATYPKLRVVAIRIDPCFPSLPRENDSGDACRHQVRFVVQPFHDVFDDAAMHVFYEIPEAEFAELTRDLLEISNEVSKVSPLGVHPLLRQQGTKGRFADALKKAVLAHVGATRITRVTAMELVKSAFAWQFRGFEFDSSGAAHAIGILGTDEPKQEITGFGSSGFETSPSPLFASDSPFSLFWNSEAAAAAPKSEQAAAYNAALVIANPDRTSAEQASCVACHTAMSAQNWAEEQLGLSTAGSSNAFRSTFDLSLTLSAGLRANTRMFRSFGYHSTEPAINQRVVNESAAVAAFLNAKLNDATR